MKFKKHGFRVAPRTNVLLAQRLLLVWENKRLDRKYGSAEKDGAGAAEGMTVENYGPNFRYVL